MDDQTWLAERFETHRGHLRGVVCRMLGSLISRPPAVQGVMSRPRPPALPRLDPLARIGR
jgi:hypothetical protein